MTYIVTESCIRCKFMDCGSMPRRLLLRGREHARHPSRRVHRLRRLRTGGPVEAIVPDTEPGTKWLALNADYAKTWPNIPERGNRRPTRKNGTASRTRKSSSAATPDPEARPCRRATDGANSEPSALQV